MRTSKAIPASSVGGVVESQCKPSAKAGLSVFLTLESGTLALLRSNSTN